MSRGLLAGLLIASLAPIAILPIAFVPHHAAPLAPSRARPAPLPVIAPPQLPEGGLRSRPGDPSNNQELSALFDADQRERKALGPTSTAAEWAALTANDEGRRARVAEIVSTGGAETGADWYAAAMIEQHGETLDDFAHARDHAVESVRRGYEGGRWLAAAAWDRWLVKAGYPQRFGTQSVCDTSTGVRRCRPYERDPGVTDEDRARWDVPPSRP